MVRFPLAEADRHPVARQSVHPPAGKTLPPPPPPPLSLGGHFCHSTTPKKPDSVLMSMNTAAAASAAATSANDDGQQSEKKRKMRKTAQFSGTMYYPTRLLPGLLYRTICLPPSRCDANS